MPAEESKTCPTCNEAKGLDEFYVDNRAKDGRMWRCKVCVRAKQKTYRYDASKRAKRERRFNASPKGQERMLRWREANRETYLACKAAHRAATQEERAAYWAAYYEENRDELLAKRREWAHENPDKKRSARDPEKMLMDVQRRRARKAAAFVEDVPFDVILQRDLGMCGICNQQITDTAIHLDHIIPLAAGGLHKQDNVQLAHATCNLRKWANVDFTLAESPY